MRRQILKTILKLKTLRVQNQILHRYFHYISIWADLRYFCYEYDFCFQQFKEAQCPYFLYYLVRCSIRSVQQLPKITWWVSAFHKSYNRFNQNNLNVFHNHCSVQLDLVLYFLYAINQSLRKSWLCVQTSVLKSCVEPRNSMVW